MYLDHFQLKEEPFNITADPDFFYSSQKHMEAFAHLEFGISQRKGIIVISGEIGTGKTTLCRTLLTRLDRSVHTALILNPNFSSVQLLKLIIQDLGIETAAKNKFDLINTLNQFLMVQAGHGNNVALIVDEAQNLTVNQLEQIRLLSNLETEKEKLLQIILVGQPELLDKLCLPGLRQLNQRVAVRYHIQPLSKDETREYISHRLRVAQKDPSRGPEASFTEEAIDFIFEISQGTPRTINLICDRALLAAFVAGVRQISKQIIVQSSREVILQ